MRAYAISLGAKVTIQEEILDGMRTIPYTIDCPLYFEETELVDIDAKHYHFCYRQRHYYVPIGDVNLV